VVSPVSVSAALEGLPGVADTAVVPLPSPAGAVLGVLVEGAAPVSVSAVRAHLARSLPAWSQPRVVETTAALPRLASGRTDRRACIAILERSLAAGPPP
jgi:acyl-CoA synthetase (AMP-forming)/AMP-acid ligase II